MSLQPKPQLHVIDANCSWIRSLVEALPNKWNVREYRIYNPWWLPGGITDCLRALRPRKISASCEELFCIVPGWNKYPRVSARILQFWLKRSLGHAASGSAILFTFPFYSGVAAWARNRFPGVKIVYHAHDPFEFYSYPDGYIAAHEDKLVPLCDQVVAISEKLVEDLTVRYPEASVSRLGNATSSEFLETASHDIPASLVAIRKVGRPVVGCIGQINSSYDWGLLETAAEANPSTQFVFVGNLFEEGQVTCRIRAFFERPNVHWLGPKPHADLPAYTRAFDICLNPLAVSPHNDRRDTLRLYDYLTTDRPVYSTAIDGARTHGEHVEVFETNELLVAALGREPCPVSAERLASRRRYMLGNIWTSRALELGGVLST